MSTATLFPYDRITSGYSHDGDQKLLMGFPFLSGFYSKDIIIEGVGGQYIYGGIYWLGLVSILFTRFVCYYWLEEGYGRGQGIVWLG